MKFKSNQQKVKSVREAFGTNPKEHCVGDLYHTLLVSKEESPKWLGQYKPVKLITITEGFTGVGHPVLRGWDINKNQIFEFPRLSYSVEYYYKITEGEYYKKE